MERTPTGIKGFDELVEGGFPKGRSILLTGGCGTGKTIFSIQYLVEGAKTYSEPGIYVTLDERPNLLRQDMLGFGWDLRKLEEQGLLTIIDGSVAKTGLPSTEDNSIPLIGFDLEKLSLEILRTSKKTEAKRIVIDSLPGVGLSFETEGEARKAVLRLCALLEQTGATTLITSEIMEGENRFGRYGVEEFVVDGIVVLHYMGIGTQSNRTLHIRKMRATAHSEDLHPIKITKNGIVVKKIQESYENV
ncbi:MAG: hypothetical protein HY917_05455 [Candidatus Diapherotrites archaeon]|nr:hypothetical protein [Candidatus Diapherotrites archaeon]